MEETALTDVSQWRRGLGLAVPPDTTLDQWMSAFRHLEYVKDASAWYIGDLVIQGEQMFGPSASQVMEEYNQGQLTDYRLTCEAFPADLRYDSIPFSWYRKLRRKDISMEIRAKVLEETVANEWDYQRFLECLAEHTHALPADPRGRKPKPAIHVNEALNYLENSVGGVLSQEDVEHVASLLGVVDADPAD